MQFAIICTSRSVKKFIVQQVKKMSVFTQIHNPMTGKLEWGLQREDYDYKQEVARSAYADMLHDQERNDKYFAGLKQTISELRRLGQEVHVLDIGTGTGLLSMMAVSCGADSVTACEAFTPMANCAQKVLEINGCSKKIKLIFKRSTELKVGPGMDLEHRVNLLVTEVFDTELIGEGAIETFRHAKQHLLTEDAMVVPSEGRVFAQVVSSSMMQRWNRIHSLANTIIPTTEGKDAGKTLLTVPEVVAKCPGAASLHDLQLSQVPSHWFTAISQPLEVFWFDWSGHRKSFINDESSDVKFKALSSGDCDTVLMWWDLKMDQCGDVNLSCAPYWAHPLTEGKRNSASSSDIPWRDHWMQAVYYLPKSVTVKKGETLSLKSSHDEYSLWFNLAPEHCVIKDERPVCECGLHIISSRTRLGQLNDPQRLQTYMKVLQRHIKPDTVCLCVGDTCFMAIAAAKLGARHVYTTEGSDSSQRVMQSFVDVNELKEKITTLTDFADCSQQSLVAPVNLVFSEPYFSSTLLPWHSLYYWYLHSSVNHLLDNNATILPHKMTLWALPVQFRDLWKIRAPLHQCCGFKMQVFDELIETACEEADEKVEPHPLWEYPAMSLAKDAQCLLSIRLDTQVPTIPTTVDGTLSINGTGTLNGVAIWADWHFSDTEEDVITTGPVEPVSVNSLVEWDVYTRQGVYLFKDQEQVGPTSGHSLNYSVNFQPNNGTIGFQFKLSNPKVNYEQFTEVTT